MAAGMGSRYGGLKQVEPVGPAGEMLVDYSIFDAIRAGFERAVFIGDCATWQVTRVFGGGGGSSGQFQQYRDLLDGPPDTLTEFGWRRWCSLVPRIVNASFETRSM